ncbi:MAG: hypothetical protein JXB88_03570 [Spirochaetales bacterium]|nr:hypothetical protein [Spirochaetales bacterium]
MSSELLPYETIGSCSSPAVETQLCPWSVTRNSNLHSRFPRRKYRTRPASSPEQYRPLLLIDNVHSVMLK